MRHNVLFLLAVILGGAVLASTVFGSSGASAATRTRKVCGSVSAGMARFLQPS